MGTTGQFLVFSLLVRMTIVALLAEKILLTRGAHSGAILAIMTIICILAFDSVDIFCKMDLGRMIWKMGGTACRQQIVSVMMK